MKRPTLIILTLSLIVIAVFAIPILKPLLPNYKGIVMHEEKNDFLMTSQSIDESVVMSPWEIYQKELPQWKTDTSIQEIFSKNLNDILYRFGMSENSSVPMDISSVMQTYQEENQKAYFIKNYQYQDVKGQSFLLNIAWAQLDDYVSIYFHVVENNSSSQDKTHTITNQEIIDANQYLQSFYNAPQPYESETQGGTVIQNPFDRIEMTLYDLLNSIYETQTITDDFYQLFDVWDLGDYRSVVYENELLLDFQSYMPNSQLMLFYNVKKSCFSGFSIKMMI